MIPSTETLHPDSSVFQCSAKENVVKKTDTAISKVFENEVKMSSADYIIKKIKELNPGVEIEVDSDMGIIHSSVSAQELKLPEGFYYTQKNEITNKNKTQSGYYGRVRVYPSDLYSVYY